MAFIFALAILMLAKVPQPTTVPPIQPFDFKSLFELREELEYACAQEDSIYPAWDDDEYSNNIYDRYYMINPCMSKCQSGAIPNIDVQEKTKSDSTASDVYNPKIICFTRTMYGSVGDSSPRYFVSCWPQWTGGNWTATRTPQPTVDIDRMKSLNKDESSRKALQRPPLSGLALAGVVLSPVLSVCGVVTGVFVSRRYGVKERGRAEGPEL